MRARSPVLGSRLGRVQLTAVGVLAFCKASKKGDENAER